MNAQNNAVVAQAWMQSLGPYLDHLLLTVTPWAFLFAGIGFVVALLITSLLFKKKLLLRHVRAWNFAAKLIYVLLLFGLPTIGGLYGCVYGTHRQIFESMDKDVLPIVVAQMPAIRHYVGGHLKTYQPGQMVTARDLIEIVIKDYYYVPTSDTAVERFKAKWINEFILRRSADVLSQTLQRIMLEKIDLLGESLKKNNFRGQENSELAKFGVDVVMKLTSDVSKEVDFTTLDKTVPNILVDAIKRMIDGYFRNVYIIITLLLLVLIGVVAAEIFIYRRYYLPDASFVLTADASTSVSNLVGPGSVNVAAAELTLNQKRMAATKDGIKVLAGSGFTLLVTSIFIVIFALMTEAEPFLGWWLVGVCALAGIILSPVVFGIYIFFRRKFQPGCKPKSFLLAYAISLILFRICGVSYLKGMQGNVIPALIAVLFVWLVLFSLCLVGLRFYLKRNPN